MYREEDSGERYVAGEIDNEGFTNDKTQGCRESNFEIHAVDADRKENTQLGCEGSFVCANERYGECSRNEEENASETSLHSDVDHHETSELNARVNTQHGFQDSNVNTEAENSRLNIDTEISSEEIHVGIKEDCRKNGEAAGRNDKKKTADRTVSFQ